MFLVCSTRSHKTVFHILFITPLIFLRLQYNYITSYISYLSLNPTCIYVYEYAHIYKYTFI